MPGRTTAIAKISGPRLHGVVPRERLYRGLDDALARGTVGIEGPPGAGKTSLAASHLVARGAAVVWSQTDPGDADPSTFFYYLSLAAPTSGSSMPRSSGLSTRAAMAGPQPESCEAPAKQGASAPRKSAPSVQAMSVTIRAGEEGGAAAHARAIDFGLHLGPPSAARAAFSALANPSIRPPTCPPSSPCSSPTVPRSPSA